MSKLWTYLYQGAGDQALHIATFDNEAQCYSYAAKHLDYMWHDEAKEYTAQRCGGDAIQLDSPEAIGSFWNLWEGISEYGFNWLLVENELNPNPLEGETIV